jgi:hypothetical protein
VEDCRFSGNVGRNTGGAVFASHRTRSIIRACSFVRNRAEDEPLGLGGAGGAVTVWANTDATIRDCLFLQNEAERGGALAATRRADGFHRGSLLIEGNEIDGNSNALPAAYSLYLRGYAGIVLRHNNIVRHRLRALLTESDDFGLFILAEGNWWGSPMPGEIESSVLHVVDDVRRDVVDFIPFATSPF